MYHCRQWKSWHIYASLVANGINAPYLAGPYSNLSAYHVKWNFSVKVVSSKLNPPRGKKPTPGGWNPSRGMKPVDVKSSRAWPIRVSLPEGALQTTPMDRLVSGNPWLHRRQLWNDNGDLFSEQPMYLCSLLPFQPHPRARRSANQNLLTRPHS